MIVKTLVTLFGLLCVIIGFTFSCALMQDIVDPVTKRRVKDNQARIYDPCVCLLKGLFLLYTFILHYFLLYYNCIFIKKTKQMATSLKRPSILTTFASKRTQLWQYLNTSIDAFLRDVGLRTTKELTASTNNPAANLYELQNEDYVLGGVPYKKYCFQSWMVLPWDGVASNAHIQDLGIINVSQGFMLITEQSTNISADDSAGVGGFTNGAVANGGTLVEDQNTSVATTATLAYINQDNGLTGVDDNYLFAIVANTGLTSLECEVYVKIEFAVEAAAKVEYIQY